MPLPISSGRLTALAGVAISFLVIATAVVLAYRSHLVSQANPLSDDASVFANVTRMATSAGGRVKSVPVQENAFVQKGTLLLELDDTAYRLAVEQARADLELAEAAASDKSRNIQAELANADIAGQQVERARSNLDLASQSLERLRPMAEKGYVSAQQLDDARTLKRDAEVSLREALRQQDAAQALVGDELGAGALVRARRAALAIAEHELAGTRLFAPHDGHVVGLTTSVFARFGCSAGLSVWVASLGSVMRRAARPCLLRGKQAMLLASLSSSPSKTFSASFSSSVI